MTNAKMKKDKNNSYFFNAISEKRSFLMGISTLLVMFCHSWSLYLENLISNEPLRKIFLMIRYNSTLGVDCF